jgi:hypothetical protein
MSTSAPRKRKSAVTNEDVGLATAGVVTAGVAAAAAAPPAKKSRAKKTPPVVAVVSPTGITGSFLNEQRPLIAHIPVTTSQLTFDNTPDALKYDPNNIPENPKPYDQGQDSFSFLESLAEPEKGGAPVVEEEPLPIQAPLPPAVQTKDLVLSNTGKCRLPMNYSEKLMVLFQDSNRTQALPTRTDVACFWCCHSFSTAPVAVPSHILDEVWYMYGNFCSPECACAYLFKEKIDSHVQWERYALLNSLYAEDADVPLGASQGIRPAPPREVLRMFGGSMDISEYRGVIHEKKLRVDVLTPPMVSIIQTMDTKPIDFYDQNLKNVFIRNDLQHKYNAPGAQGLRLRRSKPVKSREATVEWAMKIQTVGVAEQN